MRVLVVVGTVKRGHDVGVLLQAAAVAQVGELRAAVGAPLDLAVKLGGGNHRDVQLHSHGLQAPADHAHFVLAALDRGPGHADEAKVVHHDDLDAVLADLAAGAGAQLVDGRGFGIVNVKRVIG